MCLMQVVLCVMVQEGSRNEEPSCSLNITSQLKELRNNKPTTHAFIRRVKGLIRVYLLPDFNQENFSNPNQVGCKGSYVDAMRLLKSS